MGATADWSVDSSDPVDRVFSLFGTRRRRCLIAELGSQASPVATERLAEVLSQEDDSVKSATVRLHHIDLPMLHNAGLLTYDPTAQLVYHDTHGDDVRDAVDAVESALESLRDATRGPTTKN